MSQFIRLKNIIVFVALGIGFSVNAQNSAIPVLETGGRSMPNEWIDNATGHRVIKLVNRPGINSSFYFHNNPFIKDPKIKETKMIFFGIDSGVKNAYAVNLKTKKVEQISFSKTGMGGEIVGHKYNNIYYQEKNVVYATNVITKETKKVYEFPENYRGYIATVNADETYLAGSKASDAQAEISKKFPEKKDFFDRIFDAHLPNDLFTINIKTGELKVIHTENTWLGHVQFSPTQPNLLMFCHEGPWHKLDRIWHINILTSEVKLMHKRTMDMEIAGHEWFSPDGNTIWFDLQQPKGETFFVAGTNVQTGKEVKYKIQRNEWSIHFNTSDDLKMFCGDGGDSGQVARAKDGQWIYHFTPSGDSLKSEKLVNMKHQNYRLEPNVHFTPDGKWIVFRANFEGDQNVYAVEIRKYKN
jgi:oligogalacturonide lyase